jgi:hypothetical protein
MFNEIMGKIDVSPPYYALKKLRIENENLLADILAQQPMGCESGSITAAEVGRHLAILGSCSLAMDNPNPGKHYYLVNKAELKKFSDSSKSDVVKFVGKSRILRLDKRDGMTISKLYCKEGKLLYKLATSYHILKEKLFEKIFANKKIEVPFDAVNYNPYLYEFPVKNYSFYNNRMWTRFGPLSHKECNGHFPEYPCIPVSILMHALCRNAGRYLANILNIPHVKYSVSHAKMNASNLAFSWDSVLITTDYIGSVESQYKFECKAFSQTDTEYAKLQLTLEK